ncbi:MAG: HAD family hydrolase [Candidatus Limivicinus sp.]
MKVGVLFDLDGTLLDTLEDLRDGTNYALGVHGYPSRSLEEVRRFVGNGAENLIRRALPSAAAEEEVQKVLATFRPYYNAHCRVKTKPYDGISEALRILSAEYPVAIVSNKPDSAVKPLCADYFPGIFALGETEGCPRKPAPDMVYKAMKVIGAERCIYVGDSEVDVLTAKNAGVPCLSVLWGFRHRADMEAVGGSCFCEKPEDLVKAISEIESRQILSC